MLHNCDYPNILAFLSIYVKAYTFSCYSVYKWLCGVLLFRYTIIDLTILLSILIVFFFATIANAAIIFIHNFPVLQIIFLVYILQSGTEFCASKFHVKVLTSNMAKFEIRDISS